MNHLFESKLTVRSVLVFILAISTFLIGSTAIADIVSESFKTALSTDLNVTQLTIARPDFVAVDDLLLATIAVNGGSAGLVTPPSGWNLVLRTDNDTNVSALSYWKIAGASEPGNYTWTISPQTHAAGGITSYGGVDTNSPIDSYDGDFGRSNIATAPSIMTTRPNTQIVTLYAFDAGKTAIEHFSTTTGMTKKYDITNTPYGPSTAVEETIQASAGASGPKSSTINYSGQRDWVAQQIALRPTNVDSTLPNGLVSYWKFDGSSGNAIDSVGANTLTNNNATPYVPAKINNGAQMTSTSLQYFSIPDSAQSGLDLTGDMSISMWVKFDSVISFPPTEYFYALATKWNNGGQRSYEFAISNNLLSFSWSTNGSAGGSEDFARIPFTPVVGTWYHLVVTYTASNALVNFYIDNVNTSSTMGELTSIHSGTADFSIGGRASGMLGLVDATYDGVGIWNRVLTSDEVSELYNGGAGIQYPF